MLNFRTVNMALLICLVTWFLSTFYVAVWCVGASSGGHMSESSLRREPGVELDGAPWLAVRTAVGPTCGGERRTQANLATPRLGRRSASPPPPVKVGWDSFHPATPPGGKTSCAHHFWGAPPPWRRLLGLLSQKNKNKNGTIGSANLAKWQVGNNFYHVMFEVTASVNLYSVSTWTFNGF